MGRGRGPVRGMKLAMALGMLAVVAGCGASEPYLFKRKEFERDSQTFNLPRPEGAPVQICYNGWWTSEAALVAMAETECARYGKSATPRVVDEQFGTCPLFVPIQASFACEGEAKAVEETKSKGKKKNKAKSPGKPQDAGAADAASEPASGVDDGAETAPDPQAQLFDTVPNTREDETLDAPL